VPEGTAAETILCEACKAHKSLEGAKMQVAAIGHGDAPAIENGENGENEVSINEEPMESD
jgi:hypothetical protein